MTSSLPPRPLGGDVGAEDKSSFSAVNDSVFVKRVHVVSVCVERVVSRWNAVRDIK